MSFRFSRIGALGLTLLSSAVLAGCGTSDSSATTASVVMGHPPQATAKLSGSPQSLVTRVGLVTSDLVKGDTVKVLPQGDLVKGQVTLDMCGYRFTTESHRVARHQVAVYSAGKALGISNEVVAYDSASRAQAALDEFRSAVLECLTGVFRGSTVEGVPDLAYELNTVTTNAHLPVADNAVATIAVRTRTSPKLQYAVLVFQRKGKLLDGVYLQAGPTLSPSMLALVQNLAKITGKRLAGT